MFAGTIDPLEGCELDNSGSCNVFIQKSIADKMGCGVPLFSNAFLMVSCAISQKVEEALEAQLSCARMSLL